MKTETLEIKNLTLNGLPASGDIAIGNLTFFDKKNTDKISRIPKSKIKKETEHFQKTAKVLSDEYLDIFESLKDSSDDIASIYETSILILNDQILIDRINDKISQSYSASFAVDNVFNEDISKFNSTGDSLLKERADDLNDIKNSLIARLNDEDDVKFKKNSIVVAKRISIRDIIKLKNDGVAGFVTEEGGLTSHTAIIARAFDITSVIGIKGVLKKCNDKCTGVLDSISGSFIINPDQDLIKHYRSLRSKIKATKRQRIKRSALDAITRDDKKISVLANLDYIEDLGNIKLNNADGIGLVRTENIIHESHILNQNKQKEIYQKLSDFVYPNPVTIRLFDYGSDKVPKNLIFKENNPALGNRGIRFLLNHVKILETQIAAILKASKNKNVKILVPMISNESEAECITGFVKKITLDLEKKFEVDTQIEIGAMIEIPSAAFQIPMFAKYFDFFSIGTNDLMQYLFAADRTNDKVSEYYSFENPVLYKVLDQIIKDAVKFDKKVSICGEIAYHTKYTKLLLGLGASDLSLASNHIPEVKSKIRRLSFKNARREVKKIIKSLS